MSYTSLGKTPNLHVDSFTLGPFLHCSLLETQVVFQSVSDYDPTKTGPERQSPITQRTLKVKTFSREIFYKIRFLAYGL